jgi:hypothetical protein
MHDAQPTPISRKVDPQRKFAVGGDHQFPLRFGQRNIQIPFGGHLIRQDRDYRDEMSVVIGRISYAAGNRVDVFDTEASQ